MTNDQIEFVARGIVTNLGFDPDELIPHDYESGMTPQELKTSDSTLRSLIGQSPRWVIYRNQAALAIATIRAVRSMEN